MELSVCSRQSTVSKTKDKKLPTANCLLPTSSLPIAYCQLSTVTSSIVNCLLVAIFCLLPFTFCFAYVATTEEEPIICQANNIEYSKDGKKMIASGDVRITYKGIKLTCDRLKIDAQTKDAYARGNVVLSEEGSRLVGENLIYNLDTKEGSLDNASLFSPVWYGKGKKISKVSDNEFKVSQGYITTCDPRHPHCADYRIL